ncbi:exosortase N [Flaviaesturariibacter amylovorans]|uniref:Exosortase N n=1 Tax=Flaviaesturariibacter amylovorans TaxID=1084520 RepID=A0ABP8GDZ0_9BACT
MQRTISLPAAVHGVPRPTVVLLALYAVVSLWVFQGFLKPYSLPFALGMLALPFCLLPGPVAGSDRRWMLAGAALLLLTALVPVKTLLFLSLGCLLFGIAPRAGLRAGPLAGLVWIFVTPIFTYFFNAFSFPIRLQLAAWAGGLLRGLAVPVSIQGHVIVQPNGSFSIDPGCMGLNMLVASLLLGAMTLGYYQRRLQRRPGTPALLFFFGVLCACNVLANLIRILLLVWFVLLPGTPMHEVTGLACLLLYVGVPAAFLARRLIARGQPLAAVEPVAPRPGGLRVQVLMLLLFTSVATYVANTDTNLQLSFLNGRKAGAYAITEQVPGVLKLSDGQHLLYVKFVRGFYDTDHSPTICWTGNGYTLAGAKEERIGGQAVFTAQLQHEEARLYTAWWYSDGAVHTTRQWEWRERMLRGGRRFAVVNVTAASPAALRREVASLLGGNHLPALFRSVEIRKWADPAPLLFMNPQTNPR